MSVTPSVFRRIAGELQRFLLPAACLHCGQPLGAGRQPLGLCLRCRGILERPPVGCPVCGGPLPAAGVRSVDPGWSCERCRDRPPAFAALRVAWSYEAPLPAVIAGFKYRRLDYLGAHLADELAAILTADRRRGSREPTPWDLVVPVPLHWRRRWIRGFNQAERIARPLAGALGVPFGRVLRRVRPTRSQARLTRTERLDNPRGAFSVRRRARPGAGLVGARVLLVDDVVTTGATLDAAASALVGAGAAEVTAVAAARTQEGS